jgi:hypothetical protein
MTLKEAYNKAKDHEYLMNWYNGRHYKKSEIDMLETEIEFFYAIDDGWIIITEKQLKDRTYKFHKE